MAKPLTDKQRLIILQKLYDAQELSAHKLPYTDNIDEMRIAYNEQTGLNLSEYGFCQLLLTEHKNNKLPRKTERKIKGKSAQIEDTPKREGGFINFDEEKG